MSDTDFFPLTLKGMAFHAHCFPCGHNLNEVPTLFLWKKIQKDHDGPILPT